jgi:hypothetical protein
MSYVEVSLLSLSARENLPKEEMAHVIDYIRRAFPYRSSDHFYRSSSDYLVIHTAKERLTRKQESWLEELRAILYTHPDTNSGCSRCYYPFDDAPVGICETCHRSDPYKVSSIALAFERHDFKKLVYLSRWVWGTIENVYARWTAVALAQLLFQERIAAEQIRQLNEDGDQIAPLEEFQNAGSVSQDDANSTLTILPIQFMKQEYLLVQRAAERCSLDVSAFIRRSLWSAEAEFYVRCRRAATGRVYGCDLGLLFTGIDEPLIQIQQLQIETEDVKSTASTRLFNSFIWYLFSSTTGFSQEHPLIATKLLQIVRSGSSVSESGQALLQREKKRLQELNSIPSHDLLPCTEQEVLALEQVLGYTLPLAYRALLLWIGHGAGQLMQDLDCFYEHLFSFQKSARQLLREHGCSLSLPEDAFVFFQCDDSSFSFIRVSEGEDPPVYAYESTWRRTPFKKIYRHFSDFVAIEIEIFADFMSKEKTISHEVKLMLQTLVDFNGGAMFPAPKGETSE